MVTSSSVFGEIGSQIVTQLFSGVLYFGIAIIVICVLAFLGYWFLIYKKKFNIKVKIISSRAKDRDYIFFDKAAILYDRKTKTKYFRIWGLKIDLPAPNFNVLQSTSEGDYLELYRVSEDTIYFLTPPMIDKRKIIKSDGNSYLLATQKLNQIDPDISFWNAKRKDMNKKMFDTEGLLMKILPYIPLIFGGMIMIFILYILLDHLPGILSELRELTATLNQRANAEIITGGVFLFLKWKRK